MGRYAIQFKMIAWSDPRGGGATGSCGDCEYFLEFRNLLSVVKSVSQDS